MWQISWKILVYFGIGQVHGLKLIYMAYQVESLRAWQSKFKVLKDLKTYSFWAIVLIQKDGDDGKFGWILVEFWTFLLEFPFWDC